MYKFLLLIIFTSFLFIGCEDTPNAKQNNLCNNIICNSWKTCDNGKCQLNSNRCDTNNDCKNNLICNNLHTCIENIDKTCKDVNCGSNGQCFISGNTPTCVCNSGYHSENLNCIKNIEKDPCKNITCSGNGICKVSGNDTICICNSGYHSDNLSCIKDTDNCKNITCSGNGECALSGNTAICVCNNGYHSDGLECIEDINICNGITCSNNGICAISNNSAICVCNNGFHAEGLNCIKNINPCNNVNCSDHGTCLLSGNQPVCVCDTGYFNDGLNCEIENPCENIICDNWKTCIQGICELKSNQCERNNDCSNNLICDSNHNCVNQSNPCNGITCSDKGTCGIVNDNAVCICNDGYSANGLNCISEVNPCDGINCSNLGTCVLSNNSPICICQEGFHNDGLNCIKDINQCENINCSNNGVCVVSGNNPLCICNDGYTENGLECVLETSPCDNIDCSNNGVCAISGNNAICICNTDFHSDGLNCVKDINTCDNINCSNNGVCAVSGDTALCVCNDGYHSEGLTCIKDIDPCESINCSGHGNCLLSGDQPICVCDTGYTNNNLKCIQTMNPGDLIISEFMANPSIVNDTQGEWIELYNTTSRELNLDSVTINKNTSSINLSGTISPNSYFVIAKSENSLVPYDLIVSFSALSNTGGSFSIKNNGITLHEITYPSSLNGKSWQLSSDNYVNYDDFSNWCAGSSIISDTNSDMGTPKTANLKCSNDLCNGINCNNGQCLSDETEYICVCDNGYAGDFCNTCDTGYHFDTDGTTCIKDADLCNGILCDNHGTCISDTSEYICVCDTGYTDVDNSDDCAKCDIGYHFDTNGTTCVKDSSQNLKSGDLIITEVMANPSFISDTQGEWIEIYNTTSNDILLENFEILKDTTSYPLLESGKIVASNSYFIIARTNSANLPQIDAIISMSLTNSNTIPLSIKIGNLILDTISNYKADSGISWQRDSDNTWCNANSQISNDNTDLGTPGTENSTCEIVDLCQGVTCNNHGSCLSDETEYICVCDEGYTGDNCETCDVGYVLDSDGVTCIKETVAITWCNVQYPSSINANLGDTPTIVYGQVYISGITDTQDTESSLIISQLGYTYQDFGIDLPIDEGNFYWINSSFNVKSGNNHEYQTEFPTDEAESFYYIYRFSVDDGQNWTYCDLDGIIANSANPGTAIIQ